MTGKRTSINYKQPDLEVNRLQNHLKCSLVTSEKGFTINSMPKWFPVTKSKIVLKNKDKLQ